MDENRFTNCPLTEFKAGMRVRSEDDNKWFDIRSVDDQGDAHCSDGTILSCHTTWELDLESVWEGSRHVCRHDPSLTALVLLVGSTDIGYELSIGKPQIAQPGWFKEHYKPLPLEPAPSDDRIGIALMDNAEVKRRVDEAVKVERYRCRHDEVIPLMMIVKSLLDAVSAVEQTIQDKP